MNDELERERIDALDEGLSDAHRDMTPGSPRFTAACANSPAGDMPSVDPSQRSSSGARHVMGDLHSRSSFVPSAVRALLCLAILVALFVPRADRAQSSSPGPLPMQIIAGEAWYDVDSTCGPYEPTNPLIICNAGFTAASTGAFSATYPNGVWIPAPAPGVQSELWSPVAAAAAPDGSVYIADQRNSQIRRVDTSGNVFTYALLSPTPGTTPFPTSVAVDHLGNVYYGSTAGGISVNVQCSVAASALVGNPGTGSVGTEGGAVWTCQNNTSSGLSATSNPQAFAPNGFAPAYMGGTICTACTVADVAVDGSNNVYALAYAQFGVVEQWSITEYDPNGNMLRTIGPSPAYGTTIPVSIAVDSSGFIFAIDGMNSQIVQFSPDNSMSVIATAQVGSLPTTSTPGVNALAVDSQNNLYVLMYSGNIVYKYDPVTQEATQIAGTGTSGFINPSNPSESGRVLSFDASLDGPFPATQTRINFASGISLGPDGALYIADTGNNLVWKVGGQPPKAGCSECGPTTMAVSDQISRSLPSSWAFDPTLHKLYTITSSTPAVVTVFDTTNDTVLDNISLGATSSIDSLALDTANNLVYVGDQANDVIYVISANTDQQVSGSPVSLPGAPRNIAIVPGHSRAYITIANGGYSYPSPSLPAVAVVAGPSLSNPSASYVTGIGAYNSGTSLSGASSIVVDPQRDKVYVRYLGTVGSESAYSFAEIDASSTGNNAITTYELSIASNYSGTIYPDSMAVDESTGNVLIGDSYDQYVHLFEYSTQTLSGFFGGSGGFFNYHVAADSVNGIFYTWDGYGNVGYLIPNQASGLITSTSVFGNSGLTSVAVDSSTEQAYIANCNTTNPDGTLGTLTLWDGLKDSVITTLPLEIPSTATSEGCGSMFVDSSSSNPAAHSVWLSYSYSQYPSGVGGGIDVINGPTPAPRPVISVSPSTLSFGAVGVGQGSFVTSVTIQNNGTAPLTGTTPIFQDAQDAGSIQINNTFSGPSTCGAPVAPGASCVIYLQFTPSKVENFSGSILFLDNSPDTPQSISVTGAGVPATGPLTISPLAFPPGVVNQTYYQQILVSGLVGTPSFNVSGSLPQGLSLVGASLSGTPTQAGTYNFTITATDTATGKSGSQFYSLIITSTAGGQTQVGVSGAGLSGVISFGNIEFNEPSATLQTQLENTRLASVYANLQITGVTLSGPNAGDFLESDNCVGQSLPEFSSCTINVTFKPTVQPTANEVAQLILSSNAALQPIFLTGTSAVPLGAPASLPVAVSVDNANPPNLASTSTSSGCYPPECGGSSSGTSLGAISSGGKFAGFSFAASSLPGPPPPTSSSQPQGAYLRNTCIGAAPGCEQSTQYISYGPTTGPAANGGEPCNASAASGGSVSTNVTGVDSTGQYVLFESNGCAFSSQTFQNATQIFLRDVINGVTSLISIDPTNSVVLSNGASHSSMSNNGDFFAFASASTNADANFTNPNGGSEVYWRGCTTLPSAACTPSTVIVSQDNVNDSPNDSAGQPSISATGRFVAFSSTATQLTKLSVPLQNNVAGTTNVFLWDSCAGAAASACTSHTILISQDANGNAVGGTSPSVSADGRFVVFLSTAPTLLPAADQAQYGGTQEVYLVDTCLSNGAPVSGCHSQPPILVSQLNGVPGNVGSTGPTISADGASVLFSSGSATLTTLTLFNQSPVYKYTNCLSAAAPLNCAASLQIISVDANGNPIQNVNSSGSLDPTGQYFTFGEQQISGGVPITEIYLGPTVAPVGPLTITTLGLPNAIAGTTYSQTITATGAGAPATFAVTVGALPPGLTLSVTGTLSGTPTTEGLYDFTVTALGAAAQTAQQAYEVTIYPPLSVTPTSLPNGLVGSAYSQSLTATGGTSTGYTWSVTSGSALAAVGLTLSPSGLISGTPTATESASNVTVQVTDSGGFAAQQTYQLTVTNPAPVLLSIAVTPATPTVSAGSTQQFTATGTYSDNSTQDLTTSVTWSSSNTSVATISSPGGLATAVAPGSSTITATLGSISGSTVLTVPLSISEPVTVTDSVSVVPLTLVAPIQVAAPVAYFTQGSPLGFNSTTGSQQTVGIENIGATGASLALTSVAIPTGAPFSGGSISCFDGATQAAIPSGAFCTVTITYNGSSPASDTSTLTFTDNAGLSNLATSGSNPNFTQSIILNGAGSTTAPPAAPPATVSVPSNGNPLSEPITVTDQPFVWATTVIADADPVIDFSAGPTIGFNNSSGTQTLIVYNTGQGALTLSPPPSVSGAGAGQYQFALVACSAAPGATSITLPSGGACTYSIVYTASANPANDNAIITFTDNAGLSNLTTSGSSPHFIQSIALSGSQSSSITPGPPSATVSVPSDGSPLSEPITVTDGVSVSVGPIVTGVSPNTGSTGGGTGVTITGAGFTGATAVTFGGTPATNFIVNSDTQITATSPAGTGTVDVTVTNPVATGPSSAADQFTYESSGAPLITGPSVEVTGSTTAAFSGTVNPEGLPTNAFFQYGPDPKYTGGGPVVYVQTTPGQIVGSDFAVHPVTASVSGLIPNTLYHVQLVGSNSSGTQFGPDMTFTTLAGTLPSTPKIAGTVKITSGSGTYNATITLTNNSAYPLSELTLLKATLGSAQALTFPAGTTLINLAPGASATLTATFSTSAGSSGQSVPLTLSGTYTAGSFSGSWTLGFRSVTLP